MRTFSSRRGAALTASARFLLCIVFFGGAYQGAARGQSYEVLQAFSAEGGNPQGSLLRTPDGKLYGTSSQGGFAGQGSVFVLTPDGSGGFTFATLHEFNGVDGATPYSNLILGTDGNLYGTTSRYGATGRGTFFQITPSGTLTTLHSFVQEEGSYSHSGLILATDGNFYGTTQFGGTVGEGGTVFRISPSGSVTTLYSFSSLSNSPRYPYAGLIQATDGNFYGTTLYGGPSESGTIFKMTPSGTLTTFHTFAASEGAHSQARLIQDSTTGDLWGTTKDGPGTLGLGTVFKITLSGTLMTVYSFTSPNGAFPYAGLIQGADGSFFGTTQSAGPNGRGTVFRITSTGSLTTLHAFGGGAGADPYAGVIQDADGNLYGTTNSGASATGTVFRLSGTGTLDTLHSFAHSDIRNPYSDLIQASDGNIYGTTFSGGVGGFGGYGTVFKMTPSGTLTILHNFVDTDGSHPRAGLIHATDGNFYGTTQYGGASRNGTVFQMTPSGTLTTFHSFAGSDGAGPNAGLVQATDGNFYGTTQYGGASGNGTVFQMTPSGILTTLHSFAGSDGANPYAGLIQATDGNLYGTTPYGGLHGAGTVFSITPSGDLSVLYNFDAGSGAGYVPYAAVIQAADGNFYGTTTGGGVNNRGTIFKLTPSGVLTTLHDFDWPEGAQVSSRLLQGSDGNFYGTAVVGGANGGYGTVFKMTPAGAVTVLHSLAGGSDGSQPSAGLIETAGGDLYGTASSGASVGGEGGGVIFRLSPCARPTAVAVGSASICSGSSTPLTGSGGVSCSWSPSTGLSDATSCSPSASPSATTTYTLTVTDASGCASTNSPTVTVTVNPLPAATITPSGPTTFCAGDSVMLTASAGSSYLWSTGATTPAITVGTSGGYSVRVTDANGCFATSATTTVTVNSRPTAVASGTATIVAGSSTPLSGSGGVSCSWSPAAGLSSASSCSPTASPAATTTYALTVTDANGCVSTNNATVTVTVVAATSTTISSFPNPSQFGQSVTLSSSVNFISGGPVTGTVTFKDGVTTLQVVTLTSTSASYMTSDLSAGDHSITATYSGDATHAGSSSLVLTQTVHQISASFFLTSPTPSEFGHSVALTAFLSSLPGKVPTGSVTLRDGVVSIGTGALDSSGHATFTMSAPSVGSHPITIFYAGDTNFLTGTSRVFTHKVINFNACGTLQGPLTPSLATGTDPQGVAVGDFNGDGKTDLASANFTSNTVSVFLGNGDNTFQAKADYVVGTNPLSVAVGDFNGDGYLDLAVANAGSGNVSVLLNAGNGTFLPAQSYGAGSSPQSVAVGDFNGDGRLDLVVSNLNSADVSVLLGNGDGTFQAAVDSPAGTQPSGVAVGDFNNDSKPDIAVGNFNTSQISVLLGNGDGTFQAPVTYAVGPNPISVAAGDFEGNGILDLAVANFGAGYVSVLLGNGDGTFKAHVNYSTGSRPASVAVADFDGRGVADLVTGNSTSDTVSILLGNGNGTFKAAANYAAGNQPHSVAVGDFAGTGKPGVVVANELSNDLSVLPGSCPTTTTVTGMGNPTPLGQSINFTIHVTSTVGTPLPTGIVTLKDGSTTLGTGTLDSSGYAFISTSALCTGSHNISAVYGGDSNFKSSNSAILSQTVQSPAIAAPSAVCPGSTGNSASVPSAGPGATYTWTITNGSITNGAGTAAVTWSSGAASSVTLKVTVKTVSGCTVTATKTVTNAAPSAVITAPVSVCAASIGNAAAVPGGGTGATYAWTIINGTITSGASTNAIKFTAGSAGPVTLNATVTNATGCSTGGSKSVTVKPLPNATITAPSDVCPNSTGNTASVPDAGSGAHYAWTITNGTITAGAGTKNVTFSSKASGSVILKVTVTSSNGCPSTASRTIAIKPSC